MTRGVGSLSRPPELSTNSFIIINNDHNHYGNSMLLLFKCIVYGTLILQMFCNE